MYNIMTRAYKCAARAVRVYIYIFIYRKKKKKRSQCLFPVRDFFIFYRNSPQMLHPAPAAPPPFPASRSSPKTHTCPHVLPGCEVKRCFGDRVRAAGRIQYLHAGCTFFLPTYLPYLCSISFKNRSLQTVSR